jgi:hypothetical protein
MRSPYAEVAMSYVRRVRSWGGPIFLIAIGVPALGSLTLAFHFAEDRHSLGLLFIVAMLSYVLAVHVRDQFSHPQARLIPGFQKAHVSVAAGAALIIAVVMPAIFTFLAGWHSVGLIAITVFLFSMILWSTLLERPTIFWPLWFLFFFVFLPIYGLRPATEAMESLMEGKSEPGAFMLLVLGTALTLLAGARLWNLDEETEGYRLIRLTDGAVRTRNAGRIADDGSESAARPSWTTDRQTNRVIRHARRASTSRWSQVCRWQVGMPTGSSALSVYVVPIGYVMYLFISRDCLVQSQLWTLLAFSTIIMPIVSLGTGCQLRTSAITFELLLPVSRQEYLRQLGTAAAISVFESWAFMIVPLTFWWLATVRTAIPVAGLVSIVLVSILSQFWFYGVAALFSLPRFETGLASLVVIILALGSVCLGFSIAEPITEWQFGPIGLSAALAAIGLLATRAAYRRWLASDID